VESGSAEWDCLTLSLHVTLTPPQVHLKKVNTTKQRSSQQEAKMSSLNYVDDPAPAASKFVKPFNYSSSVTLPGGIIKCSGQGGWSADGDIEDVAEDYGAQVKRAFEVRVI